MMEIVQWMRKRGHHLVVCLMCSDDMPISLPVFCGTIAQQIRYADPFSD